jgi:hypothetical protein
MTASVPYTFSPGTEIPSAQFNANFTALADDINAIPAPVSLQGFRNRLIDGQTYIDQRNSGGLLASLGSGQTFIVDRWFYNATQSGKFEGQASLNGVPPPAGASSYLGVASLASTAVGSTDLYELVQVIEGRNIQDLGFGTASAQPVSLSFMVYSSLTGTFAGSLRNSGSSRSYVFTYTIGSANTWTKINVANIPGDVTGTWLITSASGLRLSFTLGAGSTFQAIPGSWQAGNFVGTNTSTNVVSSSGATFYITSIQLEPGGVSTPFENRLFAVELLLCQSYYFLDATAIEIGFNSWAASGFLNSFITFPTTMRAVPSVVLGGASLNVNMAAVNAAAITASRFILKAVATASGGATISVAGFTASAELT